MCPFYSPNFQPAGTMSLLLGNYHFQLRHSVPGWHLNTSVSITGRLHNMEIVLHDIIQSSN